MDECENCESEALEFVEALGLSRVCLFCSKHPQPPYMAAERAGWRQAACVANYVERRMIGHLQRAVDAALERIRDNKP